MNRNKAVVLIAILVIVVVVIFEYRGNTQKDKPQGVNEYNVEFSIEDENNSQSDFYTYGNYIYYCTKDGLNIIDSKGANLHSDTYNLNSPILLSDENIVGVFEKNGKSVKVYNEKGKLYSADVDVNNQIISVSLNKNGYSSVISKSNTGYSVNVFNDKGEGGLTVKNIVAEDGIPIASDVSNDNNILAVSFLNTKDIKMKSIVIFYYIGKNPTEEEQDRERVLASFVEDNNIVGVLNFMNDDHLIAVSDRNITCVKIDNKAEAKYTELWKKEMNNYMKNIAFPEKKYIAVVSGEPFINAENPEEPNSVKWYSLSGDKINEFVADREITGIQCDYGATIIKMDRLAKAINNKGGLLWEYHAIQDVEKIMFAFNANKILFVCDKGADVINMDKKK